MLRIAASSAMAAFAAVATTFIAVSSASAGGDPTGVWLDDTGRGAVEISPCGGALCGKVVWVKSAADKDGCGKAILGGVKPAGSGRWVIAGLVIAMAVTLISPLASPSPDGLEWVAEQVGFLETAQDAPYELLPDYTIPFLGETAVSTIVAGILGTLIVAGITYALGRMLQRGARVEPSSR